MEDRLITLKFIKKQKIGKDEAVEGLLKTISELQIEIGVVKGELGEALDRLEKMKTEDVRPRKLWLKDEVIEELSKRIKTIEKRIKEANKSAEDWRDKYFQIINKPKDEQPLHGDTNTG